MNCGGAGADVIRRLPLCARLCVLGVCLSCSVCVHFKKEREAPSVSYRSFLYSKNDITLELISHPDACCLRNTLFIEEVKHKRACWENAHQQGRDVSLVALKSIKCVVLAYTSTISSIYKRCFIRFIPEWLGLMVWFNCETVAHSPAFFPLTQSKALPQIKRFASFYFYLNKVVHHRTQNLACSRFITTAAPEPNGSRIQGRPYHLHHRLWSVCYTSDCNYRLRNHIRSVLM